MIVATIELIHPKSGDKIISPWSGFCMVVKEGLYEEDLTDEQFQEQLSSIISTPPRLTVFSAGAMNSLMDVQTRRMKKEAIDVIQTVDRTCAGCGYCSFHCFGFQDFGRYRVTSQQATLRDRILVQRSEIFIALDSTPDSSNAPVEVKYRLWLGKSVIALFRRDQPRLDYREWLTSQIEEKPATNPPSVFLTYDCLSDLAGGLGYVLSSIAQ